MLFSAFLYKNTYQFRTWPAVVLDTIRIHNYKPYKYEGMAMCSIWFHVQSVHAEILDTQYYMHS